MREATVHASYPSHDGNWLVRLIVPASHGKGLITISSPKALQPGQSVAIEPDGSRWKAVEG